MTRVAAFGLLLMLIAFVLVMRGTRRPRVRSLGAIFITAALIFHFFGELPQFVLPGNAYRFYVDQAAIDRWLLYAGIALVAFAVAYVRTVSRRSPGEPTVTATRWPSWKSFLLITVPLWLFAVGGATVTGHEASYWADGLVTQFLLLLVPVTVFLYLRIPPARRVLPTLILAEIALVLVGQRLSMVGPLVMIAWALAATGRSIGARKVILLFGVLAMLGLRLLTARVFSGREIVASGEISQRFAALTNAIGSLRLSEIRGAVSKDIFRIDGNAWPAIVLERQTSLPTVPLSWIQYDFIVAVPRFIYASKLDSGLAQLEEEGRIDFLYRIPTDVTIPPGPDWLPRSLGTALAYGGRFGLLALALVLGWALAVFDMRTRRRITFAWVVLGMSFAQCLTFYERDLQNVLGTLRGAILVIAAWQLLRFAERAVENAGPPERRVLTG